MHVRIRHSVLFASLVLTVFAAEEKGAGWSALFNGENLNGWTVKVAGQKVGEDVRHTFRVEDGAIKVGYDDYEVFRQQFAHLYTNSPYSHYVLQLDYKLTGEVMADAPSWTRRNSGVMIHSQSPLSMTVDQLWPVSLEFQFLADGTTAGRQTGNACTPGTDLVVNGEFTKAHIIDSTGPMPPLDEWVHVELEVHGHELVIHRVNGVEVLRYTHPTLDESDADAQRLLAAGASPQIGFGHIALQAEGHPVWFRNIRIRPLTE